MMAQDLIERAKVKGYQVIESKALDGQYVDLALVCPTCGMVFWGDYCPNVALFGKCELREEPPKAFNKARWKYRKTPASQVTLQGNNLRALMWRSRK